MLPAAPPRTAAGGRGFRAHSGSCTSSAFLASLFLLLLARAAICDPSPVSLRWIRLEQTHDMLGWTPSVYFQCEGEEKRALTGVESANVDYNFTLHESFQPLTELQPPQCKRCGMFEADSWTRDDTFAIFELCPLAFSAPPASQLHLNFTGEFRAVLSCPACNPNGKALYSEEGTADSGPLSPILITLAVIGGLSCLAALTPSPHSPSPPPPILPHPLPPFSLTPSPHSPSPPPPILPHPLPPFTLSALQSAEGTADSGPLSPILITFAVIGGLSCLAALVALLVFLARRNHYSFSFTLPLFLRRRIDPNTAKFLEMFEEEEEDGLMEARLRHGGEGLGGSYVDSSAAVVVVGDGRVGGSGFTIAPDHSRQDD
ncbi:unnamed protein product [Closterium sp. Naga37s-1]|nr:unnamed protein product [Closterium sp. Naga37s-1]